MINFDTLLEKVGAIGFCQILVCLLLSYDNIVGGFNSLITVFIAYEPDYRCRAPPLDNATVYPNLTESDILNLTTPYDKTSGTYDYCRKYGYNYTNCDGTLSCVNKSANQIQCDKGYWYDRSMFTETVVTQYNLVCQRSFLAPFSTSMFYVGMLIGSVLFGNVADRYGRKPTFIISAIFELCSMVGCTFSTSVEMYTVFRTLVAGFHYGTTIATFVYIMEIVGSKYRTLFGIIYQIAFTLGFMIVGGLAYNWRNWHKTMFMVTILSTPLVAIAVLIPESPRWLFAMEKDKKGMEVTKRMARLNKVILTDEDWDEAGEKKLSNQLPGESAIKYSVLDLFKNRGIRFTTFNVMFNWFVNSFVYYGISLNAGSLAGDIFVNNTLNGVFELASYVALLLVMNRLGRRLLLSVMLVISGLGLLASVVVNEYAGDNHTLVTLGVVFAFIAKFGISGSFAIIYIYTTELYPTVVRSNGLGTGSVASRIGGITAPYVISLQTLYRWLPNVIFGVFALVAGALSLTFQETNGKPMMETIEQAEVFYKTGIVVDLNQILDKNSIRNDGDFRSETEGCDNLGFQQQKNVYPEINTVAQNLGSSSEC